MTREELAESIEKIYLDEDPEAIFHSVCALGDILKCPDFATIIFRPPAELGEKPSTLKIAEYILSTASKKGEKSD